ncbi:MAG TPA: prepilin-type N-terminal cleavage/methylation domain-containing protein [Gammaproteobacteria bacterium]|nr:prepilin-type N-terminal cleavage/methylation domain-containing protein [Gammaproteobacteria bacterium]
MKNAHGFTLVELMVTLTVIAILATVAVPSFTNTIKDNRMVAQINRLAGSLAIARSDAIRFGREATVCVSSDQATCTGETNWELGWMVWVDLNGNNLMDAGEERQFVEGMPGGMTFTSNTGTSEFVYSTQGTAASGTLELCDDRTAETGRQVRVSSTGRPNTDTFNGCS